MLTGLASWALWVLLVHERESAAIGLARLVSGRPSLASGTMWAMVDPIVVALPLAAIVTVVGSLVTAPAAVAARGRAAAPEAAA
jgi:SSS family solute:Na+ symporter